MANDCFKKMVDFVRKEDAYLKEETQKFNELKIAAEDGDVLAEFSYGEQLYYNGKFLDCIYWLAKAFFENRDNGGYYQSDLMMDAFSKMNDEIVDVPMNGYGYELDIPVNVKYTTGEEDYLKSISPLNGYVVTYKRLGSMGNRFGTMIDKFQAIIITNKPKLQLQRYYIYMNMYSKIQWNTLIEGFDYKKNLRDETKKIKINEFLTCNNIDNLDERYEFVDDLSKTSLGQIEEILQNKERYIKKNMKENYM